MLQHFPFTIKRFYIFIFIFFFIFIFLIAKIVWEKSQVLIWYDARNIHMSTTEEKGVYLHILSFQKLPINTNQSINQLIMN